MYKHRMRISSKPVLLIIPLFIALLAIFKDYAFDITCPAISCDSPTGCVGACYSSLNLIPFAAILAISILIPVAAYRMHRRIYYH